MPETAAGKTTFRLVVRFRAPRPYDASRRYCGTAWSASSETVATSGVMSTPTARPATNMFESGAPVSGWTIVGLSQVRAQNPSTTLGMDARTSMIGLMVLRARGEAYSLR